MTSVLGRARALVKPEFRRSQLCAKRHLRHAVAGPGARIIGKVYVPSRQLRIGSDLLIYGQDRAMRLGGEGEITIGHRRFINAGAMITARQWVQIGDDVAIAYDVIITDSDDHGLEGRATRTKPVVIGYGVWVGARSIILPGVTIGERAVVAAGSIVTHDVPAQTLVAGQAAKAVRYLSYPDGVARAWHDAPDMQGLPPIT